jgi:hypothetical protein
MNNNRRGNNDKSRVPNTHRRRGVRSFNRGRRVRGRGSWWRVRRKNREDIGEAGRAS